MAYHCPHCDTVIYSRRNPFCGGCLQRLPDHMLVTPEERKAIEKQMENSRQRRRRDLQNKEPWLADSGNSGGDFNLDFF